MTPEEIRASIVDGVAAAFKNPNLHCRYDIDPKLHAEQHREIKDFLETMARIDSIKWEVAKKIATYLAVIVVVLVGYGAMGQIGKFLGVIK